MNILKPYATPYLLSAFLSVIAINKAFAESENTFNAAIAAETGYMDNFLYQTNNTQSTSFYRISSDILMRTELVNTAVNVDANIATYHFNRFSNDNHTDFTFLPTFNYKFTQNQRVYLSAHWLNNYVYRGTEISLGKANELSEGDKKETKGAKLGYEYGTLDSQARLVFNLHYQENGFKTRRQQTALLDSNIVGFNTQFNYLLSGKTYLALNLNHDLIAFNNNPMLDRKSSTALVGIKWSTTLISELSFLIGYQNLTFEDARLKDDDAFMWTFDYNWNPREFINIKLSSNKAFSQSYRLLDSYRLVSTHQLLINYQLTEKVTVHAKVAMKKETYTSPTQTLKEDYISPEFTLNYQMSEKIRLNMRYQLTTLNANYGDLDYDNNTLMLGIKVAL